MEPIAEIRDNLSTLPFDLIKIIASNLSVDDLMRLKSVCKLMKNAKFLEATETLMFPWGRHELID
ncbi:hypothetical protein COLO4_17053 [Corchorus olitorius]|uniref:F-box domain-containing protein n=1 Tax=Corchorus olitorius TaxID=93759 RepID=A0A1R3JEF3_9ROSI|nr:hypothetical protein COLO4_17053 [Corchorus olitorius]